MSIADPPFPFVTRWPVPHNNKIFISLLFIGVKTSDFPYNKSNPPNRPSFRISLSLTCLCFRNAFACMSRVLAQLLEPMFWVFIITLCLLLFAPNMYALIHVSAVFGYHSKDAFLCACAVNSTISRLLLLSRLHPVKRVFRLCIWSP